MLRRIPATLGIILLNVAVFGITWLRAGSLEGPNWMLTLLDMGAQFNPLTLDKQWFRIFTYMFLHGGIIHLIVNMFALFAVGLETENLVGTKKFLLVYLVTGLAAGLSSLYWNLFTVGVGASGAIFGLFGFFLLISIYLSRTAGKSVVPVIVQFMLFVLINFIIGDYVRADHAAHFGGMAAGMLIGTYALAKGGGTAFKRISVEYFLLPILCVLYFALPRHQVRYFKFFQGVVAAEDSARFRVKGSLTDDQYLRAFIKNANQWEAVMLDLDRQRFVPAALANDTFNLRRYIGLRKQENIYKKNIIQRESYIYLDSVEAVQNRIPDYLSLSHNLHFRTDPVSLPDTSDTVLSRVKVFYDSQWVEVATPPATYYRLGHRDSLNRWHGAVQDFYSNGDVQMKGTYKRNKRDGVFLYYSDHQTYTSAGRYRDDAPFGKWENFHDNGKLASEVYFNNGYFVKSLFDSAGNQLVIDGNGREIHTYPDGVIASEGVYRYGAKEGYWYGRHANGEMYFEENYVQGKLMSGKSRTLDGQTFVYDASSLQPMPEGGFEMFHEYVRNETKKHDNGELGHAKLAFRVTTTGAIADLTFNQHATPALDAAAEKILRSGPRWLPAREHGHRPVDGWSSVLIEFY